VDKRSPDNAAMLPYWTKIADVQGGIETMRAAGKTYLPSFKAETPDEFSYRLSMTKMTNIFSESLNTLAAKPFQEPVMLKGDNVPTPIQELQYDIDGRSNSMTLFAAQMFKKGIANALHWVLVDNPPADKPVSIAEAKKRGTCLRSRQA
jgi:hypothetical protein